VIVSRLRTVNVRAKHVTRNAGVTLDEQNILRADSSVLTPPADELPAGLKDLRDRCIGLDVVALPNLIEGLHCR